MAKASKSFFALKSMNMLIITFYSFALVYVLIRILPENLYPIAVLVSSCGFYVMSADLGYSGFVYFRTRQSYLQKTPQDGSESEVFNLYMGVALIWAALGTVLILAAVNAPLMLRVTLSVYLLTVVLSLPWALMRKMAAAVDLFLQVEVYEFVRRGLFLVLAAAMLLGLPFWAFCLLCMVTWVVVFAGAHRLLRQHGVTINWSSPGRIYSHVVENWHNIGRSGALTLMEFAIYNFPYIAIPLMFGDARLIVPFDIFYKIVRFGAVSYAVPAESSLPPQTRAYYGNDRPGVMKLYYFNLLLGLLPLCVATAVLLLLGNQVFTTLLAKAGIIDHGMRIAMVVMLAGMLVQVASGTFLVGTGNYSPLCRLTSITVTLMGLAVIATWFLGLTFDSFMALYVAAYCMHAVFYTYWFFRFLSRPGPSSTGQPIVEGTAA